MATVKKHPEEERDMERVKIQGRDTEPFSFDWRDRIDLSEKVVLAFGGGGNLSETFLIEMRSLPPGRNIS